MKRGRGRGRGQFDGVSTDFFRIGQFPRECSLPFTVNSGYGQVATASIPVARSSLAFQYAVKNIMNANSVFKSLKFAETRCLGVYNIGTEVHAASVWKSTPQLQYLWGSPLSSLQSWTHSLLLKRSMHGIHVCSSAPKKDP